MISPDNIPMISSMQAVKNVVKELKVLCSPLALEKISLEEAQDKYYEVLGHCVAAGFIEGKDVKNMESQSLLVESHNLITSKTLLVINEMIQEKKLHQFGAKLGVTYEPKSDRDNPEQKS